MQGKRRSAKRICLWMLSVLVLLLVSSFHIYVQAETIDHNNYESWLQTIYSREEGLSVGTANAIATTSDGIIWIGTYAGLYRYNGSRFQLMNQYDTVRSVECLYVDDQDRLWVGTNDKGISVFQDEQLLTEITEEDGLPSNAVRSIVQSADGEYYIGTSDSMAVLRYAQNLTVCETIEQIEYADRSSADEAGHVTAVTSYGTMYLMESGSIVDELSLPDNDQFTSCVFDVSGHVYAGTSLGHVYVYAITDQHFQRIKQLTCNDIRKVNNLIRINEDTIFVCADNGIGYFDGLEHFHSLKTPNFTSNIYNVIVDYQGNLWFSSSRMGLLRLCKTSFIELFTEYNIPPVVVNTIERYAGKLMIGTDSGLVILDEQEHKRIENELTEAFDNVRIRHILRSSDDHLWFCTYGKGLVSYDGEKLTYIDPKGEYIGNRVRTILERANGELAVSSEHGIAFLKGDKITGTLTKADGLLNQINLCMLERPDGTLLIGSDGDGIAAVQGDTIQTIGTQQGLPSGVILRMENDAQGDGVFVVTSNSLCYITSDGTVQALDHFPYSNNYSFIQQDETIFVLGSAGIYAVRRDQLLANSEDMQYIYLDNRAGLHDALVANSWILHDEEHKRAYLATSSGVTMFDLAAYDERPSSFYIRISSIDVDGEEKPFDKEEGFAFSRTVRRLEIQPEIINYSTVDPVISCYLEGFDRSPIVMPQSELSSIVYTNLPPGKYTFNMDLVDAESGARISQKVYYLERETAFTETVWFYVLIASAGLLVATLIGLFVARRTIAEKERALAKTWKMSITDELTGLQNRLAMRFSFPQYVGQSLTVTMMDIDYFKRFNDSYGHDMGDEILQAVSQVIDQYYSAPNAAYRFGGDEFLLLDVAQDRQAVARKLRTMTEEISHIHIDGCKEIIHMSYGSAAGTPQGEEELRALRNVADQRLYEAKKNRHY